MKLSQYLYVIMITVIISSCEKSMDVVTDSNDYNTFISHKNNKTTDDIYKRLQFWNRKMNSDSTRIPALGSIANVYTELFTATGDITYLKKAEKTLEKSVKVAAIGKKGYLLALARNYISQHRFLEALKIAKDAHNIGGNTNASAMVLFDISMELGDYKKAEQYLESFANHNNYNFLIRLAKWSDHNGNLVATIGYMEKAMHIAEKSNKDNLMLWSYTNLADYYGHAGKIEDSYTYYLKALKIDPSNAYAKKGIAWIVYSYEHNPDESLRILEAITEKSKSPDYALLKAEIAEYKNDTEAKEKNLQYYFKAIKDPRYGDMYNTYRAMISAEEFKDFDSAVEIALKEIKNRPTPQSYALLAHVLNLRGEHERALEIAESHIIGKTYEPETYYQLAQIYKANHLTDKMIPIKKELQESSYELGPLMAKQIENL